MHCSKRNYEEHTSFFRKNKLLLSQQVLCSFVLEKNCSPNVCTYLFNSLTVKLSYSKWGKCQSSALLQINYSWIIVFNCSYILLQYYVWLFSKQLTFIEGTCFLICYFKIWRTIIIVVLDVIIAVRKKVESAHKSSTVRTKILNIELISICIDYPERSNDYFPHTKPLRGKLKAFSHQNIFFNLTLSDIG